MDKPITVARQEFMDSLVELINGSGLPAFVLVPIFEGMTQRLAELERMQYEADKANYEKGEEDNGQDNVLHDSGKSSQT